MSILKYLASDGFLTVNKHLAKIVGLDAAVLLAELASSHNYFESTGQLKDGMFYETVEHIEDSTTLTKYQQSRAVKVLEEFGVLETKKIGLPAKRYFRLNAEAIASLVDDKWSKNRTTVGQKTEPQEVDFFDINNNKDKKEKKKEKRNIFTAPTLEEVLAYCAERQNSVDPEKFVSYYESNGWMVGRNKMKDWKAAVRTWERNQRPEKSQNRKAEELESFYRMSYDWAHEQNP